MFQLFYLIASMILGAILGVSGVSEDTLNLVLGIFVFAMLLPVLSISVRRLHDSGRSGWFILISFIPLANLLLLYWYIQDSEAGTNKWGPNPKGNMAQNAASSW